MKSAQSPGKCGADLKAEKKLKVANELTRALCCGKESHQLYVLHRRHRSTRSQLDGCHWRYRLCTSTCQQKTEPESRRWQSMRDCPETDRPSQHNVERIHLFLRVMEFWSGDRVKMSESVNFTYGFSWLTSIEALAAMFLVQGLRILGMLGASSPLERIERMSSRWTFW